jgi:hypothetical protein
MNEIQLKIKIPMFITALVHNNEDMSNFPSTDESIKKM